MRRKRSDMGSERNLEDMVHFCLGDRSESPPPSSKLRGTWKGFRYSYKHHAEVCYEEFCSSASVDDRSNERSRCRNVGCERRDLPCILHGATPCSCRPDVVCLGCSRAPRYPGFRS